MPDPIFSDPARTQDFEADGRHHAAIHGIVASSDEESANRREFERYYISGIRFVELTKKLYCVIIIISLDLIDPFESNRSGVTG